MTVCAIAPIASKWSYIGPHLSKVQVLGFKAEGRSKENSGFPSASCPLPFRDRTSLDQQMLSVT